MPTFNFGAGIRSNPMDAYNETAGMVKQSRLAKLLGGYYQNGEADLGQIAQLDPQAAQAIQKEQEQRGLAKLFGEAYAAPEDQRGGMLGQLIARGANPDTVMKLDPRYAKGGESYTLTPGSKRFGPDGKLIAEVPISDKPKYSLREFNGGLYYVPEEPMMGGQPQAQNSPAANQAFDQHIKPLMEREGGFVANDAGAGPTNFGINSRANPDVDVQNLTPDAAQQLYKQRYWDAIGGDQLPPYLQAGAFDAAVNMGVGKARELLQASGGDPAKFDQLRMQHYEGLARSNPQKYAQYLPSWRKRVQETSAMGGMQEQYQDSASGALPAGAIPVPGLQGARKTRDAPSGYQWNDDGTSLVPIPGGPADRKNNPTDADMAKGEMGMRKELQDRVKQDKSVLGMFNNVQNAAKSGTAAGDLSMIFAYMKMLDPGSVVREQEFANAQNATGIPDRILNVRNQILSGNRLNPLQREQFIAEARQLAAAAQDRVTSSTREYQGIAEDYGYNTSRATGAPDFRNAQGSGRSTEPAAGQAAPRRGAQYRVGQVIEAGGKRYRIVGGDMNDPDVEEVR